MPSAPRSPSFANMVQSGGTSHAAVVWDGMIFTVVTIEKCKTELCLAPGCRASPNQCGHGQQAAREPEEHRVSEPQDEDNDGTADADDYVAEQLDELDCGEADGEELEFLQQHLVAAGRQGEADVESDEVENTDGGPVLSPPPAAPPPSEPAGRTLSCLCQRSVLPCPKEIAAGRKRRSTAELLCSELERPEDPMVAELMAGAIRSQDAFDPAKRLDAPAWRKCRLAAPPVTDVPFVDGVVRSHSRSGVEGPVMVGSWMCDKRNMMVNFDGAGVCLFVLPRVFKASTPT